MTLFGIGFLTPWLLATLAALPILWIILRAVPPAPIRRMFPGVVLLLGLKDDDQVSDRTPWWLLLLRMLAVAALIIGLAGPILNPQERSITANDRVLVVLDGTWASAHDWQAHQRALDAILRDAAAAGQTVATLRLTAPEEISFQSADTVRAALPGLLPQPWAYDESTEFVLPDGAFDTIWVSDSLDHAARAPLVADLQSRGAVRVLQAERSALGLRAPRYEDGIVQLTAVRTRGPAAEHVIIAQGRDPAGRAATLASGTAVFEDDAQVAELELSLPAELRARITRFEIEGIRSAGAVALADDGLQRREVALMAGREDREGLELLSPLHYLQNALEPNADLLSGALSDVLPANPDVIVFADIATVASGEEEALLEWVDAGGLLLRFAGPRVAASDLSRSAEDPLMPVRLRAGGRTVGGAMSWGEPKTLAPFPMDGPFAGLDVSEEVVVSAQVLAQPDPTLADRVIAELADGTPLVTRKRVGSGQIVFFHVTANAEWSTLPLSGLFVQMLDRLAVSTSTEAMTAEALEGTTWQATQVMDAFGNLDDAGTRPGVDGPELAEAPLSAELLPGLYSNDDLTIARNVIGPEQSLARFEWPDGVRVEGLAPREETPLAGLLLASALGLLLVDVVASLWLSGRLGGLARAAAMIAGLALVSQTAEAQDQSTDEALALLATQEVVLAHVLTGDARLDDTAAAGLRGLSETLFFRTSVEPADPIGVDLERDELAFFPFLYWPVSEGQPIPSDAAYSKLNAYLRSGGMILFDTRDAHVAGFGAATPQGQRLQQLAAPLDIPPLEPLPEDHVLTRTFYLLQDFPGRHAGRSVWVEAAPPDAEIVEGMPFRNLNDGVTPVVIGGNDWGAAWAVDQRGNPLFPVGRGYAGERQREMAYRFGVNLIMHVLTGNYKSDQVHVPALLDRLGQ
ncbi:DUF4159 domain-containing protein [Primorskyibacter sp. S187A]|uniref:DUF4159 domain-containing protein n=1 Tax=Primorskyibacter sp. S187A TaxID=3415130 RepID=UPI003C7E2860